MNLTMEDIQVFANTTRITNKLRNAKSLYSLSRPLKIQDIRFINLKNPSGTCFTDGNIIYLSFFPEELKENLIFVDSILDAKIGHEMGHVNFTNFDKTVKGVENYKKKLSSENVEKAYETLILKVFKDLLNILEDARIERLMAKNFKTLGIKFALLNMMIFKKSLINQPNGSNIINYFISEILHYAKLKEVNIFFKKSSDYESFKEKFLPLIDEARESNHFETVLTNAEKITEIFKPLIMQMPIKNLQKYNNELDKSSEELSKSSFNPSFNGQDPQDQEGEDKGSKNNSGNSSDDNSENNSENNSEDNSGKDSKEKPENESKKGSSEDSKKESEESKKDSGKDSGKDSKEESNKESEKDPKKSLEKKYQELKKENQKSMKASEKKDILDNYKKGQDKREKEKAQFKNLENKKNSDITKRGCFSNKFIMEKVIPIKGYPDSETLKKGNSLKTELSKILVNKNNLNLDFQEKGQINPNLLPYSRMGLTDSIFKIEGTKLQRSYAISILLDGSGSMNGPSGVNALKALSVIEEALKDLCSLRIIKYNSGTYNTVSFVYKDYNDKNINIMYNSLKTLEGGFFTNANAEYINLDVEREILNKRPETDKIVIILSDGMPRKIFEDRSSEEDLRKSVQETKKKGIKVVPIFFGHDSFLKENADRFKFMYEDNIVATSPDKIYVNLVKILREALKAWKHEKSPINFGLIFFS